MDHLPIQFSGYPRARPGTRAGGTISSPPFGWLKIRLGRQAVTRRREHS